MTKQLTTTRLTGKQSLFSAAYFTIGSQTYGNGVKSAKKAGYNGTDNYLARVASENVRKCSIIAEGKRINAKSENKLNVNRDYLIKKTKEILETSDNETNKIKALSLIGDFIGAKRENAPNSEAEALKAKRMSVEDKRLIHILARQLTRRSVDCEVIDDKGENNGM